MTNNNNKLQQRFKKAMPLGESVRENFIILAM